MTDRRLRPFHGVIDLTPDILPVLKRYGLIIDKFYLIDLNRHVSWTLTHDMASSLNADLEFLQEQNIARYFPQEKNSIKSFPGMQDQMAYARSLITDARPDVYAGSEDPGKFIKSLDVLNDIVIRGLSEKLNDSAEGLTVPFCRLELPETLNVFTEQRAANTVLRVAIDAFPVPGDACSWQDILDFKTDERDKLWGFHRFLNSLATKKQTEAEVRDDIEWTLKEYRKATEIHRLKA